MPTAIQVRDLFTGSAGTLDGHSPGTIASGTAVYETPTNYLLTGSGGARANAISSKAWLDVSTLAVAAGVYAEMDITLGRFGSTGTNPPSTTFFMNFGGASELPSVEFDCYGSQGDLSGAHANRMLVYSYDGGTQDIGAFTHVTGDIVTLRIECDPYLQTTKYYLNGSLVFTGTNASWYLGSETFAPEPFTGGAYGWFPTGIPGSTVHNTLTRLEFGTLGLTASNPFFWERFIASLETP